MAKDATMKLSELRGRAPAELQSLMDSKNDELHKARFKHALGQLSTTHQLRQLKRDIARLQTVLNQAKQESAAGA